MTDQSISLNKFISSTGICSRREADKWIEAKRVRINGRIARKGNRVHPRDKVTLDGRSISNEIEPIYLMLNKPPGITSTTDAKDKDNIIKFLNYPERVFPIGRLDKASSGLILLTNDGDIVNKILRVENKHEKEYIVSVDKDITDGFLKGMASGVPILGTKTRKCEIQRLGNQAFRIVLTQGLNRQIRRMCEYFDYNVVTLKRVRIMHIKLKKLGIGDWRHLYDEEISLLYKDLK